MSTAEYNIVAAGALLDELAKSGCRRLCMSPGSRSSPLTLAADRHPDIELRMITDERSAAYFALGMAKATGETVAVGCTSGTAAANFLPAVVEAALAHVPLIVLTADRPPEQIDIAAAQTIRQAALLAGHAVWSVAAPVPDSTLDVESVFRTLAARLVGSARELSGPVHANLPFREPLWDQSVDRLLDRTRSSARRAARAIPSHRLADESALTVLTERLAACPRGLIIAGGREFGASENTAEAAIALAQRLGWPILADGLSPVRSDAASHDFVLDTHEVLARCASVEQHLAPQAVVRFGAPPTSKALAQLLARWATPLHVLLTARSDWPDPGASATDILRGEPDASMRALAEGLARRDAAAPDGEWLRVWCESSAKARAVLDGAAHGGRFEGSVAQAVVGSLASGEHLVVGNSMPVRDVDVFAGRLARGVLVHANRGANGIDGVLSTALGVAAASGKRTVALIGDLSFVHDLGALQIAKRHDIDLSIVVPNNDGGGIFGFLQRPDTGFEELFATPHGMDLASIVPAHGIDFIAAATVADVSDALAAPAYGPRVIEIRIDREDNVRIRNATIAAAVAAVEAAAEAAA